LKKLKIEANNLFKKGSHMKYNYIFVSIIYCFALSSITNFCCEFKSPTDKEKCEDLIREYNESEEELVRKHGLVRQTAPTTTEVIKEQHQINQDILHLQQQYNLKLQDLQKKSS
jgi:hypothetical protein